MSITTIEELVEHIMVKIQETVDFMETLDENGFGDSMDEQEYYEANGEQNAYYALLKNLGYDIWGDKIEEDE